jgi:hypothetical protein
LDDVSSAEVARDWWVQFLKARDQIDPVTGFVLPGLPNSRPFRSLAYLPPDNAGAAPTAVGNGIDHTVLRRLPLDEVDGTINTNRGLFELGSSAEHIADPLSSVPSTVDNHSRHRMLSKIYENTTTRSNVFVVFMTVAFYEAVETDGSVAGYGTGAVVIGGKVDLDGDGNPDSQRAVFVIDRSAAEDAYDPFTETYDWRQLVKFRLPIN